MMFLKQDKLSLAQLCSDSVIGPVASGLLSANKELDCYLKECRNLRQDLMEAKELIDVLSLSVRVHRVIDIGCGHGLVSLVVSTVLGAETLTWVDRDVSCRAARFAKVLQAEFVESTENVAFVEKDRFCLVMAVNLCGPSLLSAIDWYRACGPGNATMLCVPCCGVGEYEDWLNVVEDRFGSKCERYQLQTNLKRVAIVCRFKQEKV
jgi:SAM-dependent methyltransferase